tara:strand:- start:4036 stop:4479 length:444 start_codon:yes stop_codon:yes gene_type:complete
MTPKTSPSEKLKNKREAKNEVIRPASSSVPSTSSGSPPPPVTGLTDAEKKTITNSITEKQNKIADLKKEKKVLGAQMRALDSAGSLNSGDATAAVMTKINGKTSEIKKIDSEISSLKLKLKQEAHTGSDEEATAPKMKCVNGQWVPV